MSLPDGFKKFKEKTLTEISELKSIKEYEAAATEELKRINDLSGNLSPVSIILEYFIRNQRSFFIKEPRKIKNINKNQRKII